MVATNLWNQAAKDGEGYVKTSYAKYQNLSADLSGR
jgi:hypothetical protein